MVTVRITDYELERIDSFIEKYYFFQNRSQVLRAMLSHAYITMTDMFDNSEDAMAEVELLQTTTQTEQ